MEYFDAHSDILSDVTARRLLGETEVLERCHLPRLKKGNVEGSIFVIWADPPDGNYTARTRQIMDCARAELAACGEVRVVCTCGEMMRAKRDGKFYIFLGIEGLAAIGEDLSKIDEYYEFGCRHAMLTWNEKNVLGTGARAGSGSGLTDLGRAAVRKIQQKHMLLDVSHLNERSFWDLVSVASAPIVASHSNASALCDVPRNLSDEQLRAIRDLNGVVGLNAYHNFIDPDPAKQTVEQLARHAAHMIDVMGSDHVGCGFDFPDWYDGGVPAAATTPGIPGLADCTEIGNLFACFTKMGMTREEQEKIAFRNFHRALRETVG